MIKYILPVLLLNLYGIIPATANTYPILTASVTTSANSFLMPVDDVFNIAGRGTIAVGKILRGTVKTGDSIDIAGINNRVLRAKVKLIEMAGKIATEAKEGDECGLLLSGIEKTDIKRGMVLAGPQTITVCTAFTCELIFKPKEEGGRKYPIADNFRTQFIFYNTTFSGKIKLPEEMQNIIPATKITVTVTMEMPIAVEKNVRFRIMEYGNEIGSGTIIELIKN